MAAGVGLPELASWEALNLTIVLAPRFTTQRLPPLSKARQVGRLREPLAADKVTAGVGEPDVDR